MRHRTAFLFLFVLLGFIAPPASAAVVYNTLGARDSYDAHFYTVSGGRVESCFFFSCSTVTLTRDELAIPFTVTGGNFTLDAVEIALAFDTSSTHYGYTTVALMDNAGSAPGSVLESYSFWVWDPDSFPGTLFNKVSNAHPLLENNQTYWLSVTVQEPAATGTTGLSTADIAWFKTPQGIDSDYAFRSWNFGSAGSWHTGGPVATTAFRITGTPSAVPLPATIWLFVSGLFGVAFIGRCRAQR